MKIELSKSGRVVAIPPDSAFANALPTKEVRVNGGTKLLTPYTPRVYKIFKAMGVSIPSPFTLQYEWPTKIKPFEAQRQTASLLSTELRAYCLNDMGTGKTIAALAAADWLLQQGAITRVLIVSPLSTLALVWAREIFSFCPQYQSAILHGVRQKRFDLLADRRYTFYIVNHDAVHIIGSEVEARDDINLIIVDELAEFRAPNTRKWKTLRRLAGFKDRVWGLTGAPRPKAPTDVWAQTKLVTPSTTPASFRQFQLQTMRPLGPYRWIELPEGNRIAYDALRPSIRFAREDCIDLPPITTSSRKAPLSATALKAYQDIKRKLRYEAVQGDITAANAGVKLNKLLQISCGWVYDDAGNAVSVDASARLAVMMEIIEESQTKSLVFVPFVFALDAVTKHIRKQGVTANKVFGQTSSQERTKIFEAFKHDTDPHVLVCHPRTMAHGLNFQHAATVIWFSPLPSQAIVEQANARITRPGQRNPMHIIRLVSTPAEQHIYDRLTEQSTAQSLLLEMFK